MRGVMVVVVVVFVVMGVTVPHADTVCQESSVTSRPRLVVDDGNQRPLRVAGNPEPAAQEAPTDHRK